MMYQNLPTKSLSESDQKMVNEWLKKNKPLVLEDGVLKRGRKIIATKTNLHDVRINNGRVKF